MSDDLNVVSHQIDQYFTALYGVNYVYRAPETFTNALERWMIYVASGHLDAAASQMSEIDLMIRRDRA